MRGSEESEGYGGSNQETNSGAQCHTRLEEAGTAGTMRVIAV
jgi:hypothetical protein